MADNIEFDAWDVVRKQDGQVIATWMSKKAATVHVDSLSESGDGESYSAKKRKIGRDETLRLALGDKLATKAITMLDKRRSK